MDTKKEIEKKLIDMDVGATVSIAGTTVHRSDDARYLMNGMISFVLDRAVVFLFSKAEEAKKEKGKA